MNFDRATARDEWLGSILRARFSLLSALVVFFVTTEPMLTSHGIPAFRHDWQWPPDSYLLTETLRNKLEAWNFDGLGQSNTAIQVHPFFLLTTVLSLIFTSKTILVLWVGAALAAFSSGVAEFARKQYAVSGVAILCVGILSGLAPFILNKFVAGHVPFLVALATVPWVLNEAKEDERSSVGSLFLLLAWTTLQLQIFCVTVIAILIFRRRKLQVVIFAIGLCSFVQLPLVLSLLNGDASVFTNWSKTGPFWEEVQSSPLLDALRGTGYFPAYWDVASKRFWNFPAYITWIYPLSIIGATVVLKRKVDIRLLVLYMLGVIIISGLKGPGGAVFAYLFSQFTAFSAFRELYHSAFIVALCSAVFAGIWISRLPTNIQFAMASLLAVTLSAPWLSGGVIDQVRLVNANSVLGKKMKALSENTRLSRIEFNPISSPEGPKSKSFGGPEPLAHSTQTLTPFWFYEPRGSETWIAWEIRSNANAQIRGLLGVSGIAHRSDFKIFHANPFLFSRPMNAIGETKATSLEDRSDAAEDTFSILSQNSSMLQIRMGKPFVDNANNNAIVDFESVHGSNPEKDFSPIGDFWYVNPVMAIGSNGIFTVANATATRYRCLPATSKRVNVSVLGNGSISGIQVHNRTWENISLSCSPGVVVASASLGSFLALAPKNDIDLRQHFLNMSVQKLLNATATRSGDEMRIVAHSDCHACYLVLSTRYSSNWQMTLLRTGTSAEAFSAGGLNVWPVNVRSGDSLRVRYRSSDEVVITEVVATLAWIWGFVLLILKMKEDAAKRKIALIF